MTPATRLRNARIGLLLDEPFFGSLLMHLKPIEDPNTKTFSTNGKDLRYNPAFMDKLSDVQLKTVLAHEVLHCALLHPFRRGERDLRKFNIAADYAINNFLDSYNEDARKRQRAEPFPLKDLGLLDHQYDNLSAEEIYGRLIDPPDGGGNGQGNGAGGSSQQSGGAPPSGNQPGNQPGPPGTGNANDASSPGEFTDGPKDQAEAEAAEASWKVALQQAAMAAKSQGHLPAEIARLVQEFLDPKVPWREVLRTFITANAKDDYSWARPNRRYSSGGCILPGLHSPRLGPVIVAVDTSGSIGQKEFDEFMAEARGVFFDCRPEKFILVQCDARVHDWTELDPLVDDLKVECKGGGGTDFRPVFDRVAEESQASCSPPACLIYLTDMMGDFPEHEPGYPVLWAATTDTQGPFGTTLRIS